MSGFGADYSVLDRLRFNPGIDVEFLEWLIPHRQEKFENYIFRMAAKIDDSEPFYLMGYSFGGFIVQEIHKLKPAKKIVILASLKSHLEMPGIMRIGQKANIFSILPTGLYGKKSIAAYAYFRRRGASKQQPIFRYFTVRDPYYLKWSLDKILRWKHDSQPDVIQILGDRDLIFPIQNSKPNYIIAGGSHLFPATKYREVSAILNKIFI